jgi:hypothetical protein
MRVETPLSIHGVNDIVYKSGISYVITNYNNPVVVDNSSEIVCEHKHTRLYKVNDRYVTINGTRVKANEYHVNTCKLALTTMECASAKWITKWCAYHQHIGADFFLIYDNNSTDEEFELIVEATRSFPGILFRWTFPYTYGGSPQPEQQTHAICISKHSVQRLAMLDLDEYIVIEKGTLDQLITPPLVYIFWLWVGEGGIDSSDPRDYTRTKRNKEGSYFCKAICDPLRSELGLIHNALCPGITGVRSETASLYHFRGLTNSTLRKCDMENHTNCLYCEVENTTLVQRWPRNIS